LHLRLPGESPTDSKSQLFKVFPRLAGFGVSAVFGLAAAKYSPIHQYIIKLVATGHDPLTTS
jgi:hypothetical protein